MNCDDVRTMLAGYADGELSAVEREAVRLHLDRCGRCRALVADQQRVQRVLDSYVPPAVPPERWTAMRRRLAAEAEGREHANLVTRARPEPFDFEDEKPTGKVETPAARPRPVVHRPSVGPRAPAQHPAEVFAPARVAPRRPLRRWAAHAAGLLAAAAILAGAFWTAWRSSEFEVTPETLATQSDVTIHGIQMMDPAYTVVLYAGAPDDLAAVWVEPLEEKG